MGYSIKLFISLSSKYRQSLLLHIILLMIPLAFSKTDRLLAYGGFGSYANGSSYSWSVGYVLEDLNVSTAFNHSGFRNATWAQDQQWAYGLALCRGDVSSVDCDTCVKKAIREDLANRCPYAREAVIVRQLCLLKYSDVDFLREIDYEVYYSTEWMDYGQNTTIGEAAIGLLKNLSEIAVGAPDKFFANGTTLVGQNKTLIYGMVQCTRDLSPGNCKECLNNVTSGLVSCCMDETSALVVTGSCSAGYQIDPF